MICTDCGNEQMIVGSRIQIDGDTSPGEETRVLRILQFTCRNPRCSRCGQLTEEGILLHEGEKTSGAVLSLQDITERSE